MDSFSDLVRLIRLNVSIYHNAVVCGEWRIQEKNPGVTCFHLVTVGQCKMEVPGHLSTLLNLGDLVVFPRELPHTMEPARAMTGTQERLSYSEAAGKEGTGMLCGTFGFRHRASSQLLDALPPVLIIPCHPGRIWLAHLLDLILAESLKAEAAADVMLDRLSELLFIYALREYLADHPEQGGVLALYGHPRLSGAVDAIHQQPHVSWTLEALARCAAQSRTQFAQTFRAVSGWTPMQYLTWWRMQLAWSELDAGKPVAAVAIKVGYQSEAAFSRAFQTHFGVAAGRVRRGIAQGPQ